MKTSGSSRPAALHRRVEPLERRRIEVLRRGGLEDHELRTRATIAQQLRQRLDVVAALQLRRVVAHDVDRTPQAVEPPRLVRPDERLQQPRAVVGRHVDRVQVDAAAPHDRDALARAGSAGGGTRSSPASSNGPSPHVPVE